MDGVAQRQLPVEIGVSRVGRYVVGAPVDLHLVRVQLQVFARSDDRINGLLGGVNLASPGDFTLDPFAVVSADFAPVVLSVLLFAEELNPGIPNAVSLQESYPEVVLIEMRDDEVPIALFLVQMFHRFHQPFLGQGRFGA